MLLIARVSSELPVTIENLNDAHGEKSSANILELCAPRLSCRDRRHCTCQGGIPERSIGGGV